MFLKLRMDVRLLERQAAKFRHMRDGVVARVGGWAYAEGQETLAYSTKIVPVDTGALKGSGYVSDPIVKGKEVYCEIGYGGVAAPYAEKVHEDLEAYHDDGEAKYLEKGLLSREKPAPETLAQSLSELYG